MLFLRLTYLVKNMSLFVITYLCPAPKISFQLISNLCLLSYSVIAVSAKHLLLCYQNLLLFLPHPQLLHSQTFLPSLHTCETFYQTFILPNSCREDPVLNEGLRCCASLIIPSLSRGVCQQCCTGCRAVFGWSPQIPSCDL